MTRRASTRGVQLAMLSLFVGALSSTCFVDPGAPPEGPCADVTLEEVAIDPEFPQQGMEFQARVELGADFEGNLEPWSLTFRILGSNSQDICELTLNGLIGGEGEVSTSVLGLCELPGGPMGLQELAELLPVGIYTLETESQGTCANETVTLPFEIVGEITEGPCSPQAPEYSRLDLVIEGLATEPAEVTSQQFSFTWQVGYEFEASPGAAASPPAGSFNQTLMLRHLLTNGEVEEFTHEESAGSAGDDLLAGDSPLSFSVANQAFVGFQSAPNQNYALRVEIDPGDSVLQCGEETASNDAACIRLSLPGTFTLDPDCSDFD